jgi:hypothetical protein
MATYTLSKNDLKDKLVLDNTTAPKKFLFTDETVYGTVGQNGVVPVSQRWRVFRITVNNVVIYDTNFRTSLVLAQWNASGSLSDMSASDVTFNDISLPVNTDGTLVQGSYKIEVNTLYATNDASPAALALDQSVIAFNVSYHKPKAKLTGSVDLALTPLIQFTDTTDYIQAGITPTILRNLEYFDPFGNSVASTSGSSVSSNIVYTGTCSATVSSTITWDYSTKLLGSVTSTYPTANYKFFIKDFITKRKELKVEDSANLCGVYCCIAELRKEWLAALAKGQNAQAQLLQERLNDALAQMSFALISIRCGKTESLNDIIAEIKKITACGECGCGDGSPQLIPDLSGSTTTNKVIVFNTGNTATKIFATNGLFTQDNGSGFSTMYHPDFVGKVFTTSRRDIEVYADGVLYISATLNSSTGLFTFTNMISTDVDVQIRFF